MTVTLSVWRHGTLGDEEYDDEAQAVGACSSMLDYGTGAWERLTLADGTVIENDELFDRVMAHDQALIERRRAGQQLH